MGLGDADLLGDGGGGKASAVPCSICLDAVADGGGRSQAKLRCGHQFHLDCIGSAFNIKGAMQCPNCRKVEKGQWLFSNGGRQLPEFSMDDWAHDEDLYEPSYSEMAFGVHWCPFSGLTRIPASFDEAEFPSHAYHEGVPFPTHPCPYLAYFGPSSTSGGNNHRSGPSAPGEVSNAYTFRSTGAHTRYHHWDHSSHFTASDRTSSAEQLPRNSEILRPGIHPFIVGHSSSNRSPSSLYSGPVTQQRIRQAYLEQSTVAGPTSDPPRGLENHPRDHGLPYPSGRNDIDSIWADARFRPRIS